MKWISIAFSLLHTHYGIAISKRIIDFSSLKVENLFPCWLISNCLTARESFKKIIYWWIILWSHSIIFSHLSNFSLIELNTIVSSSPINDYRTFIEIALGFNALRISKHYSCSLREQFPQLRTDTQCLKRSWEKKLSTKFQCIFSNSKIVER